MITRVKNSTFSSLDNFNNINLLDYLSLQVAGDWTAALAQAIIDAHAAAMPLIIPGGTYISGPQTLPDDLVISGFGTIQLKSGSTAALFTCGNRNKFKDLTLEGNRLNVTGGAWNPISVINKSDIIIDSVTINNAFQDSVLITGSSNISIIGLNSKDQNFSGIKITSGSKIQISRPVIKAPTIGFNFPSIYLLSDGGAITDVTIDSPSVQSSTNAGISIKGSGTRNVTNVSISGAQVNSSSSYGIAVELAERVTLLGCVTDQGGVDGISLRGDTQYCRVIGCISNNNTASGMREVTSGASPNNNTFIGNVNLSNGNNVIATVGAGSVVI